MRPRGHGPPYYLSWENIMLVIAQVSDGRWELADTENPDSLRGLVVGQSREEVMDKIEGMRRDCADRLQEIHRQKLSVEEEFLELSRVLARERERQVPQPRRWRVHRGQPGGMTLGFCVATTEGEAIHRVASCLGWPDDDVPTLEAEDVGAANTNTNPGE
jgi:hypothetical protein